MSARSSNRRGRWGAGEDALLASMVAAGWSDARAAAALGRSVPSVERRRATLAADAAAAHADGGGDATATPTAETDAPADPAPADTWAEMTSEERRDVVRARVAAGETSGAIARALGTSRSAVVSVCARAGIALGTAGWRKQAGRKGAAAVRAAEAPRKRGRKRAKGASRGKAAAAPASAPPRPRAPRGPGATLPRDLPADAAPDELMALPPGRCRFMPGDPDETVACGAPAVPGLSWCPFHLSIVAAPAARSREAA